MFNSLVSGGPQFEAPLSFTFQLHNCTLKYQIPAGILSDLSPQFQIINYREESEKFKKDFESGRSYLCLHRASWNYYKNSLFDYFFPPEEIGYLRYKIGLVKLSENSIASISIDSLRQHQDEFIEEILNGSDGLNTNIKEAFSDAPKEELVKDLARILEQKEVECGGVNWLSTKLATGILDRQIRLYYLTLLNSDHAVLLQFEPYNNNNSASRVIDDKNNETINVIVDSIRLTQAKQEIGELS